MTPTPEIQQRDLEAAVAEVQGEIARADTKASLLLAAAGLAVGALPQLAGGTDVGAWIVRAGIVPLVGAVVVLLLVVRPRTSSAPFVRETSGDWRPETPRERMAALSTLARVKFRRVRGAVDLLITAAVVIGAGAAWSGVITP